MKIIFAADGSKYTKKALGFLVTHESLAAPIRKLPDRHGLHHRSAWVVGSPAAEIVEASVGERAHLIVMSTHGHGFLGRPVMGSAAQRVVTDSEAPVCW